MGNAPVEQRTRQAKRDQFLPASRRRRASWVIAASAAVIVIAAILAAYAAVRSARGPVQAGGPDPAAAVTPAAGGEIRIPLADLASGQAVFFEHARPGGGPPVRFFALKGEDGVHRAALDACEVCFHARKGYFQRGQEMVCRQCGQSFPSTLINQRSGGCHPIGVPRRVDGEQLVVRAADLESLEAVHAARPAGRARHGG